MPITIQYGPAGLAGALAVQAGQGEGRLDRQRLDLQSAQLNLQAQHEANVVAAQNKAFELQQAVEDRKAAQAARTPVADHIAEKLQLQNQYRTTQQTALQKQVDAMLASGSIDKATHQKITFGIMEGNKDLVTHLFQPQKPGPAEKPTISNAEEFELIRQPFKERRRMLDVEEGRINTKLADPDTEMMYPKVAAQLKARLGEIRALRDTEFANETAAINKLRTEGAPGRHPAPATPAKPTVDASGAIVNLGTTQGSGSVTFTPEMTDSERDIMRMSQEIADAEGLKRPQMAGAKQPKTVTFGPQALAPAPAAREQRVIGQSYLLPNGKTGIWRGTGWEVQ
jgi:hypothetical protein